MYINLHLTNSQLDFHITLHGHFIRTINLFGIRELEWNHDIFNRLKHRLASGEIIVITQTSLILHSLFLLF